VDAYRAEAQKQFTERYQSDSTFAELIAAAPDMSTAVSIAAEYGLAVDGQIIREVIIAQGNAVLDGSPDQATNVISHRTELRY